MKRSLLSLIIFTICVSFARIEAAAAEGGPFVHPGGLHTKADLDRMKTKVAAGEHPWIDDWERLVADPKAQSTWVPAPNANMPSRQRAEEDAIAMYYNAMRWYISGDRQYAECAVKIANAWSSTLNAAPGGDYLSAIPVGSFALGGEVLRAYPGWSKADFARFKNMLVQYCFPKSNEFLTTHGNSPDSRYWANWDACNMLAVLAIGVLCDDRAKFDQAVAYFKYGKGMGSIENAVPFLYPGGLGQWQESGRDQAHAILGIGQLSEFCQVAWNQGLDLFGYDNNRLLAGAEYTAQFTLWKGVPYTYYTNADVANQSYISLNYHGRLEAWNYELLYNHYVVLKGLKSPNVKLLAELRRPEIGNIDIFGYGTLAFTIDAAASPYPASPTPPVPQDLTATAGLGHVELKWSPSGAYTAQGYNVSRATTSNGPFESIYSTTTWTTPGYTDEKVSNGTTYYYLVSAINQSGTSGVSAPVAATPVGRGDLPKEMTAVDIGSRDVAKGDSFATVAGNSFVVTGSGTGIGDAADNCHYVYQTVSGDFTITARFAGRRGTINTAGLMMRESTGPDARMVAVTLGELGGRQTRMRIRAAMGQKAAIQRGNDYTWLPAWFRMQRKGDKFTASQSPDGIAWYPVGESSMSMARIYQVGLAVTGGGKLGESVMALFDNVANATTLPLPPDAPGKLSVTVSDDSAIRLVWTNIATNQTGLKIEASSDNVLFYEIADLAAGATSFLNTGISSAPPHYYRVRAYNTGGYSAYSNTAASPAASVLKSTPDATGTSALLNESARP
ncbi:MAG: alginate lyase family protein [Chthoniobacteraceae bacterium]